MRRPPPGSAALAGRASRGDVKLPVVHASAARTCRARAGARRDRPRLRRAHAVPGGDFPWRVSGPPELSLRNCRIGVIGLGYVGLPLAVEFGKHYDTTGFDIDPERIAELRRGKDRTLEVEPKELRRGETAALHARSCRDLRHCRVYVVTVPTPIDADKRPDLGAARARERVRGQGPEARRHRDLRVDRVTRAAPRKSASRSWSSMSGLSFNQDFYAGYSPERINPGDREHRLPTIRKVTVRLDAGGGRVRRQAVRLDHHGRHAPGVLDPRRRSRQGDREHAARRQHRARQRAGA